jgi:RNA polymerase sigma-70 factor (ECF subfamily)
LAELYATPAPVGAPDGEASAALPEQAVPSPTLLQLHRSYFDFTWRSLRNLGVARLDLEDAVQDVWLAAHRQLGTFEGRSTPRTWLFGITLNTARNYRRRARRHPSAAPLSDQVATLGPSPDVEHEGSEALALVRRFVEQLEEPRRILFVVYLMENVPAAEVAEILGIDPPTLYERARQLRRSFRIWFEAQQGDQR